MKEMKVGCGKPTGTTVGGLKKEEAPSEEFNKRKEISMTMVKIGTQAPDFEAPAFHNGKFIQVKLSDYLGKWVSLCFYPGDFTFV
jgi:hypothetical protein